MRGLSNARFVAAIILIILVIVVALTAQIYIDWLWFSSLGLQSVFLTTWVSKISLRSAIGGLFFLMFFINLLFTRKSVTSITYTDAGQKIIRLQQPRWERFLEGKGLVLFYLVASFFLAWLFSAIGSDKWIVIQQYLKATPFGVTDPLFGRDVGFYVFILPFYQFVYNFLMAGLVISAVAAGIVYLIASPVAFFRNPLAEFSRPKVHLSVLVALFFALKAWGYRLDTYELLYSPSGVVYGAGYTDIHAKLFSLEVLSVVALLCAVIIIINLFIRRLKWVGISIGLLLLTSLAIGVIYPGMVQKFVVEPNEFEKEQPFINYNIQFTKQAYNLDKIEKQNFPADNNLTWADIQKNSDTVKNVRLWDWQPLKQTYAQLQEMRLYYTFKDLDVDRYHIDGRYRQVVLAPRELIQGQLPDRAQTWVNQRLKYTHGYGVSMSPVNEVTPEGLPKFFIQDIPPQSRVDLVVKRPEIYYGEATDEYVIVNTKTQEFDYPLGEENVYTTYQGTGGVKISSVFRRVLFAFGLGDYKLLLANDLTLESRVLLNRNIHQSVRKVAPFLCYDRDPYLVIGSDGKLYWIQDAYTVTDKYPYSEPTEGWGNYVRNSVKVVIDAYNGSMTFYITDKYDPLITTYAKILPSLFVPLEKMPADLKQHIRYPEDLFGVQARMFATYHMEDSRVFYNKEDKWAIPQELFGDKKETMEPYYTIMKLPGENKPEFLLMLPFTPTNKENMVAWLCARSDGEKYGQLLLYTFPKQKLVYGPMQIEARIDQDSVISQQLTLWNQRGSKTFRGNLLVIPIEKSLLYIEPLYLQAEQSKMPELRRVIVVYGEQVVMEPTLDAALQRIFNPSGYSRPAETELSPEPGPLPIAQLIQKANELFQEAQKKLRDGDWGGYGATLKDLERVLIEMSQQIKPPGESKGKAVTPQKSGS
ncbi:MAG: UPF0182 family protein [Firmicutes bacterium]|nr:UPF0182 family protein [Bacillota bacterium]